MAKVTSFEQKMAAKVLRGMAAVIAADEGEENGASSLDAATMQKVLAYLDGKIDPEDLAKVRDMVAKYCDIAQDEPEPFPMMPRTGGDPAQDAARARRAISAGSRWEAGSRGFAARYPDAAKIKRLG